MSIATQISALQTDKTNIANAITTMGGTVNLGDGFDNFAADIQTIPQGGGSSLTPKDINFYDYDGTLLYAYTFAEVQQLTEMPEPPNHGSSFPYSVVNHSGSPWTEDLTTLQSIGTPFNVGVNYHALNNTTKLYITIDDNRREVKLWNLTTATGLQSRRRINWGDGTSETTVNKDNAAIHIYAQAGSYVVEIKPALGSLSASNRIALEGKTDTSTDAYMGVIYSTYDCHNYEINKRCGYNPILTAVEPGQFVEIGPTAFSNAVNLKSLVFPYPYNATPSNSLSFNVNTGTPSPFFNSYLEFISLPYSFFLNNGTSTTRKLTFEFSKKLKRVVIPIYSETLIDYRASGAAPLFEGCQSLVEWLPDDAMQGVAKYTFAGIVYNSECIPTASLNLEKLVIPYGITSMYDVLGTYSVDSNSGTPTAIYEINGVDFPLKYLYLPSTLTSILYENFAVFKNLREVHFPSSLTSLESVVLPEISYFYSTTPPTITYVGDAIAKIIYVPSAVVSDYQTAWPDFASIIQAMPS